MFVEFFEYFLPYLRVRGRTPATIEAEFFAPLVSLVSIYFNFDVAGSFIRLFGS